MHQQFTQPMEEPPTINQGVGTSPAAQAPPEVQSHEMGTMEAPPEVQSQGMGAMEAPPDVQTQQAATAATGAAETEVSAQYFYAGGLRTIGASTETWFHIGDFNWGDNFYFTVIPYDTLRSLTFKWVNSYRLSNGQVRYWARIQNHTNQTARFYIRAER